MKKRLIMLVVVLLGLAGGGLFTYKIVSADFYANNLIDDSAFDNAGSMNAGQIDAFLNNNYPNSCISTKNGFTAPLPTGYAPSTGYTYGGNVSAGQVIATAANAYGLNPQVLLATLEKESSVVSGNASYRCQYINTALGYGCLDSSACPVNPATQSGFSKQIINATWLFKFSQQHAIGNYNWAVIKPGWDNSDDGGRCYSGAMTQGYYKRCAGDAQAVFFDGFTTIDGTSVHVETGATAALYRYTPHFHGNQLFVDIFERWFGPTRGEGYVVATSYLANGDSRQWVVYKGTKHLIPDPATKEAWGLQNATLLQWDGAYLGSFASTQQLSRLARPSGSLSVYFVDNGRRWRLTTSQMYDIWNQSASTIIDVPTGLWNLPTDSGDLTHVARNQNAASVYLIDSGVKRMITDPNVLAAWAGDTPTVVSLSDAYFNSLPTGSNITTPKITDGTNTYLMDGGSRKLKMDGVTAQLYPSWATQSVTPALYNYFGTAPLTYILRSAASPAVYIIDQGTKHHIIDPDLLDAWRSSTFPSQVTTTGNGLANFISEGAQITDYVVSNGSGKFVVDRVKKPVPVAFDGAYATGRTVYTASTALLSVFSQDNATGDLVKAAGSPTVYLLTNSGTRRSFIDANRLKLWTEGRDVTELRPANLQRYPDAGGINAFVSDGSTSFLLAGGFKHAVDTTAKNNWKLGTPDTLNDGTLNRFGVGSAISNEMQENGAYFYIQAGVAYATTDRNISDMWGTTDSPGLSTTLIKEYLGTTMMTRIVSSNIANDSRLFILDRGTLYRLYPNHAINLNARGPISAVNPNGFNGVYDWTNAVVKDEGGTTYAIDQGTKRLLPAGPIRDQWTFGDYARVPTMTNGFLNTLPTGAQMERAIKGSGPTIQTGENLTKRWIQSPDTYRSRFAPYTGVSDTLLSVLPDGSPVN